MRPINYKKIGDQIIFEARFTGESDPEEARLIKQLSMFRFKLQSIDNDTVEDFTIVDDITEEGQCNTLVRIPVIDGQVTYYAQEVNDVSAAVMTDGTYTATATGGDATSNDERLTFTFEINDNTVSNVTIVNAGTYINTPSNPIAISIEGSPSGTIPDFNVLDWESQTETERWEKLKKLSHHRLTTFEGGAYKWFLRDGATKEDEADLSPLS